MIFHLFISYRQFWFDPIRTARSVFLCLAPFGAIFLLHEAKTTIVRSWMKLYSLPMSIGGQVRNKYTDREVGIFISKVKSETAKII